MSPAAPSHELAGSSAHGLNLLLRLPVASRLLQRSRALSSSPIAKHCIVFLREALQGPCAHHSSTRF
ncbi:hypothetical protein E2562_029195 [Oryza meyeriana var. granulata]|uniref:Uncharacterized protein n=1 Tax=Oryza meyeriana var. granulata TaxID=110450 RepID=A0A6G1E2L4_9ORYZ|nr:hypothetical protein E2562_029195 [Oryza meyeriana var. granulata]